MVQLSVHGKMENLFQTRKIWNSSNCFLKKKGHPKTELANSSKDCCGGGEIISSTSTCYVFQRNWFFPTFGGFYDKFYSDSLRNDESFQTDFLIN